MLCHINDLRKQNFKTHMQRVVVNNSGMTYTLVLRLKKKKKKNFYKKDFIHRPLMALERR
jgi:hypothetical protein